MSVAMAMLFGKTPREINEYLNLGPTPNQNSSILGRFGSVVANNFIAHFLEQNCELTFGFLAGMALGQLN